MSFIQEKTVQGLGSNSASQAAELPSGGIWEKSWFSRLKRDKEETGHDWLGGWDFFLKLADPVS